MNHVMRLNLPRAAPPAHGAVKDSEPENSSCGDVPTALIRDWSLRRLPTSLQAKRPSQTRLLLLPPAIFSGLAVDS